MGVPVVPEASVEAYVDATSPGGSRLSDHVAMSVAIDEAPLPPRPTKKASARATTAKAKAKPPAAGSRKATATKAPPKETATTDTPAAKKAPPKKTAAKGTPAAEKTPKKTARPDKPAAKKAPPKETAAKEKPASMARVGPRTKAGAASTRNRQQASAFRDTSFLARQRLAFPGGKSPDEFAFNTALLQSRSGAQQSNRFSIETFKFESFNPRSALEEDRAAIQKLKMGDEASRNLLASSLEAPDRWLYITTCIPPLSYVRHGILMITGRRLMWGQAQLGTAEISGVEWSSVTSVTAEEAGALYTAVVNVSGRDLPVSELFLRYRTFLSKPRSYRFGDLTKQEVGFLRNSAKFHAQRS